ncbi:MAG: hypothetical protein Ct9H90mP27_6140 [Gammaproteobacteria bacterium]|nr:MAG: hypothetical protein Ct9H90mP27_6140 [Gammaproteobacteria bacterium]
MKNNLGLNLAKRALLSPEAEAFRGRSRTQNDIPMESSINDVIKSPMPI